MAPWIADSARRHGITDDDILHACRLPRWSDYLDDHEMTMLIGPDWSGNLLEIGVVESEDGPVIVHAMPARDKYLEVMVHGPKR